MRHVNPKVLECAEFLPKKMEFVSFERSRVARGRRRKRGRERGRRDSLYRDIQMRSKERRNTVCEQGERETREERRGMRGWRGITPSAVRFLIGREARGRFRRREEPSIAVDTRRKCKGSQGGEEKRRPAITFDPSAISVYRDRLAWQCGTVRQVRQPLEAPNSTGGTCRS